MRKKKKLKFNLVLIVVLESKDLQLPKMTFPLCGHRPSILFVRSFVRSCVRACVRAFVRLFVRACVRSFVRSCVRTCGRTCVRSFIQAAPAVLVACPASPLYCPCTLIDRWWIPYYTHFSEQCHICQTEFILLFCHTQ